MSQRNVDGSWVVRTILSWDRVVGQRHATPQKLGSIKFQNGINVSLDSFVVPGQNGSNSKILEVSLGGLTLHCLKDIGLSPVSVHEEDRLG